MSIEPCVYAVDMNLYAKVQTAQCQDAVTVRLTIDVASRLCYDDDDDDILFALENWQGSCPFNLAHELTEN